ncbi:NAD(P)H-binding protein [Pseudomonas sp. PDM15]|uniref:NAD(P)H-binding protein n=1 Tax=Pseudomonas sp. PDM15 TaxID=2769303 RepID=UPI001783B77C|nr:NAD(P)H-binding protein [Pseudomonas sp. PDM15]MBD9425467.1 NAD(P)H-binding protein [Pseudomonas sp. PDM15]
MKNLETPAYKLALYGARSSLGSAVLVEALHRQYEAMAIVDQLNALPSIPGLRTKGGDLSDALSVSHSVAGMDAVICLLGEQLPGTARDDFPLLFRALLAMLDGLETAGVKRLLVVDDFAWLDESPQQPSAPVSHLQERLLASPIAWTLVEAPAPTGETLQFADFVQPGDRALPLRRFAAGLLDEMTVSLHVHERVRIVEGDS